MTKSCRRRTNINLMLAPSFSAERMARAPPGTCHGFRTGTAQWLALPSPLSRMATTRRTSCRQSARKRDVWLGHATCSRACTCTRQRGACQRTSHAITASCRWVAGYAGLLDWAFCGQLVGACVKGGGGVGQDTALPHVAVRSQQGHTYASRTLLHAHAHSICLQSP